MLNEIKVKAKARPPYIWRNRIISSDKFTLIGNPNNYVLIPFARMRNFDEPARFTEQQIAVIKKAINDASFCYVEGEEKPITVTFTVLNSLYDAGFHV